MPRGAGVTVSLGWLTVWGRALRLVGQVTLGWWGGGAGMGQGHVSLQCLGCARASSLFTLESPLLAWGPLLLSGSPAAATTREDTGVGRCRGGDTRGRVRLGPRTCRPRAEGTGSCSWGAKRPEPRVAAGAGGERSSPWGRRGRVAAAVSRPCRVAQRMAVGP